MLHVVLENMNYRFTVISFLMDESPGKWRPSDVH